jgi:hypothetical protein
MMTFKKVWSVILIVLGLLFFFNNVTRYYEADFYGNEMRDMEKLISRFGGNKSFDSRQYQRLLENEKAKGVIGSLLGIAIAIGGTILLNEKKKKHVPRNRSLDLDNDFPLT